MVSFLIIIFILLLVVIFSFSTPNNQPLPKKDNTEEILPEEEPQPKNLTNVTIPCQVLENVPGYGVNGEKILVEQWTSETKEALLEVENDKIIIPLQIQKFVDLNNGGHYRQKWERNLREYVAYTVKTAPITLVNNSRPITIAELCLVWKDKNAEITNLGQTFPIGTKIELRLKKTPDLIEILWKLCEEGDWKENGNDIFSLEVYSDYEIITPNRVIKFPKWERNV